MRSIQLMILILSAMVTSAPLLATHRTDYSYVSRHSLTANESSDVVKTIGVTAAVVVGVSASALITYFGGRLIESGLFKWAQSHYEPELDLLARAHYNEAVISDELIPYILEQHDQENSWHIFGDNPYKNYPLLKYKKNLDWFINSLWFFKLFYLGHEKKQEIDILLEKLKRLRRFMVTDYRFVKEQREFDKENRKK